MATKRKESKCACGKRGVNTIEGVVGLLCDACAADAKNYPICERCGWRACDCDSRRASKKNPPKGQAGSGTIFGAKGLLAMIGLPDSDELIERNQEFIWEQARPAEGEEDEDEEKRFEREHEVEGSIYKAWQSAVESALDHVASETGVTITPHWQKNEFSVGADDWEKAARALREIIVGVGLFDQGRSLKEAIAIESLRTARQYVLKMWPAVRDYAAVYGGSSIERVYERALESNLRHL